ncbi:cytochrome c oxidase assembly protein [Phenylobacterium soli]|uniref:Cytochrome c oxidase assembly protein n=1 Tax=Phenylobacterium soli TaxID=2170551 RepID=A0A328AAD5_9CAUL|nr:cytochrome c oxidase assembly protein [Phenylobacterium soli]RAK51146.1 cytochrome c oxidase assembly protein [Phenylobacterium soli]
MQAALVPYCGAPVAPGRIAAAWNLDPILLAAAIGLLAAYAAGVRRADPGRRRRAAFYLGWTIATLALVSPLCRLSVSLFSARVGQHMLLELAAAPLVAYGRPWRVYEALLRLDLPAAPPRPLLAAGIFAVALWYWHAPLPYDLTFTSDAIYWCMHVTAFGAALLLWTGLQDGLEQAPASTVGAGILSAAQMTFLGALLTLAPRPLYAPHALTTAAWGLSPLDDQQIGGLIMWAPGCLAFAAISILGLVRAMRRADAAEAALA